MAAQRRIFLPEIRQRYAALSVPRLRKVLLIGPPGTGKTTLLKAEAAQHFRQGGVVYYVFTSKRAGSSWDQLEDALTRAAEAKQPTLVAIEDFEQFLIDAEDPQRMLNVLDGLETPDNPAGTLLIGTSNAPEKIDLRIKDRPGRIDLLIEISAVKQEDLVKRFLRRYLGAEYSEETHGSLAPAFCGQTGSHIQQVCLLAAMHAFDRDTGEVSGEDLMWAHAALLAGRTAAADLSRFVPPTGNRGDLGFGKPRSRS